MVIRSADFLCSSQSLKGCPNNDMKEFAFIGRSNVGKSSLINMLTGKRELAKVSSKPGKTQLINHFVINSEWALVDLPGYGYARRSKTQREEFAELIKDYVLKRENLVCLFVLIDSRHDPLKIDMDFLEMLGEHGIPFAIVFTKTDKMSQAQINRNIKFYEKHLLKFWEFLPHRFKTSSAKNVGGQEILDYIETLL